MRDIRSIVDRDGEQNAAKYVHKMTSREILRVTPSGEQNLALGRRERLGNNFRLILSSDPAGEQNKSSIGKSVRARKNLSARVRRRDKRGHAPSGRHS